MFRNASIVAGVPLGGCLVPMREGDAGVVDASVPSIDSGVDAGAVDAGTFGAGGCTTSDCASLWRRWKLRAVCGFYFGLGEPMKLIQLVAMVSALMLSCGREELPLGRNKQEVVLTGAPNPYINALVPAELAANGFVIVMLRDGGTMPGNDSAAAAAEVAAGLAVASQLNSPGVTGAWALKDTSALLPARRFLVIQGADYWEAAVGGATNIMAANVSVVVYANPVTVVNPLAWSTGPVSVGLAATASGAPQRCCGAAVMCESTGGLPSPCGPSNPSALCGGAQFVQPGQAGVNQLTLQAGRKVANFITGPPGSIPARCAPLRDFACNNASFACDSNSAYSNTGLPGQTYQTEGATTPGSSCGGAAITGGRTVPEYCTYAFPGRTGRLATLESGEIRGAPGGGGNPPDCDGICFGCAGNESTKPVAGQKPWQCKLLRPVPGSGVCEDTPGGRVAAETAMRLEAAIPPGQSGRKCTTQPPAPGQVRAVESCVSCDATACRREGRLVAGEEYANGSGGTGGGTSGTGGTGGTTPTPGTATQATVTPAPAVDSNGNNPNAPVDDRTPPAKKAPGAEKPPTKGGSTPVAPGNNTPSPAPKDSTAKGGDPVSLVDGEFELTATDLTFAGPHGPLTFQRLYGSQSSARSELGANWSHNWDVHVRPLTRDNLPEWLDGYCAGSPGVTTCVMVYDGPYAKVFTKDVQTGLYVPQAGEFSTVKQTADGWLQRFPSGTLRHFGSHGFLTKIQDRFGNGVTVASEATPWGLVADGVCGASVVMAQDGTYVTPPSNYAGQSNVVCEALRGFTGDAHPFSVSLLNSAKLTAAGIGIPLNASQAFLDARELFIAMQGGLPGQYLGSASHIGQRRRRVTQVTDSEGRSLVFTYYPNTDLTLVPGGLPGGEGTPRAGLLQKVTGPLSATVEFEYGVSQYNKAHVNAVYLTRMKRSDVGAPASLQLGLGVVAAPTRTTLYEYDALGTKSQEASLALAKTKYQEFLSASNNCSYATNNSCALPPKAIAPGYVFADTSAQVQAYIDAYTESLTDNIVCSATITFPG